MCMFLCVFIICVHVCVSMYVCLCMCAYDCVCVCAHAQVFLASSIYTMQNTRKAPHCELRQPQAAGKAATEEDR